MNKADAYDAAIWDSNNRQILLNAVRASQRAPMSFVGLGDVSASPVFSGSTNGTFNLSPSALTGYSLNPTVSYGGGFTSFQMNNLNHVQFASTMHQPLSRKIVDYFNSEKWPEEVVQRILFQRVELTPAEYAKARSMKDLKCRESDPRTMEICRQIAEDEYLQDHSEFNCPPPRLSKGRYEFVNSAREFCSMNQFQILLRTYRLLGYEFKSTYMRSAEGILYFLGELIAAQNYSAQGYEPKVLLGGPDGHHHLVNLFVVRRGNPGPPVAAVQVNFNGEDFFIPRPQLGALDEDRSLQVLDLAATAIVLATLKEDLPKSSNINLVSAR
ncbi:hypothetical protein ABIB90_003533 [Bradyrhizobium sp. JR4.1]|uniref:hypothetical protein n=1 Tax=unclassified Bradyrhizobium TaxID=2631580 RepID=UPI003395CD18